MKKLFLLVFVLFSCIACAICATWDSWDGEYEASLKKVEVSGVVLKDLKKQDNIYSFEDSNIKMSLTVKFNRIEFDLLNKTNNTIKILWSDVIFIDIDNKSRRVIHNGIRPVDVSGSQIPSLVIKKTSINDSIVPENNNSYESLIPYTLPKEQILGKNFKISFPIQLQGKQIEYLLTFAIADLTQINK